MVLYNGSTVGGLAHFVVVERALVCFFPSADFITRGECIRGRVLSLGKAAPGRVGGGREAPAGGARCPIHHN